jgi:Ca-activated chloride channel family protein
MRPDDLEPKLTAYALDDPSLSADERREIEALLLRDPGAKAAVEETRALAGTLSAALAGELAAVKPGTITPASLAPPVKPERSSWMRIPVLAASVVFAVGAGSFIVKSMTDRDGKALREVVTNGTAPQPREANAPEGDPSASDRPTVGLPGERMESSPVASMPAGNVRDEKTDKGNPARLNSPAKAEKGLAAPTDATLPAFNAPSTPTAGLPGTAASAQAAQLGGDSRVRSGRMSGAMDAVVSGGPGNNAGRMPAAAGPAPGFSPGAAPQSGVAAGAAGVMAKASAGSPAPEGIMRGGLHMPDKPAAPADGRKGDESDRYGGDRLEHLRRSPDMKRVVPNGNDRFGGIVENEFVEVQGQNALSTFGVDVDTASYAIIRKMLTDGMTPPPAAIRLEELVNYFPYRDKAPDGDDPYRVTVELAECPWQPRHTLARIALKAKPIERDKRPPSNLVFLVDVSGSMDEPNKLPWVKQSLTMLVDQLGENDRISIVVYAGASGVVLDSTSAINKNTILTALDRLNAGGSTNGGAGIELAYAIAEKNFIRNGTNRVILCTDGDWNVGTTSTEALVSLIEKKRESNVFLSVLGFGMGNLRDEMMVKLANKGNGNYAYIDTLAEARKVLVEQIAGTLVTVAKDVKLQIEFNPGRVKSYRLLGYEKRALAARDFADDRKDAGEMGAGHVVTAFYELVPAGAVDVAGGEKLKYQAVPEAKPAAPVNDNPEAMTVKLRHKPPTGDKSILREIPVRDRRVPVAEASDDFRFGAAVATFAMTLRESAFKGNGSLGMALELAQSAKEFDPNGYRAEFMLLIRRAMQVTGKP